MRMRVLVYVSETCEACFGSIDAAEAMDGLAAVLLFVLQQLGWFVFTLFVLLFVAISHFFDDNHCRVSNYSPKREAFMGSS